MGFGPSSLQDGGVELAQYLRAIGDLDIPMEPTARRRRLSTLLPKDLLPFPSRSAASLDLPESCQVSAGFLWQQGWGRAFSVTSSSS